MQQYGHLLRLPAGRNQEIRLLLFYLVPREIPSTWLYEEYVHQNKRSCGDNPGCFIRKSKKYLRLFTILPIGLQFVIVQAVKSIGASPVIAHAIERLRMALFLLP